MAQHLLLVDPEGDITLNGEMLLVRYPDGDCDVASVLLEGWEEKLLRALYDEYQCSDVLKDGDRFVLLGRIKFKCESYHVVPCDEEYVPV
jgi:hypothetical protein